MVISRRCGPPSVDAAAHQACCPVQDMGRSNATRWVVATGKPYGAAACLDGLPGGPVMRMRMLARARVITGNELWASMTRSLRVDLMRLR